MGKLIGKNKTNPLGYQHFSELRKIENLTDAFATTQKQMQKFLENFVSKILQHVRGGRGDNCNCRGKCDSEVGRGCCHFKYEVIARSLSPSPSLSYISWLRELYLQLATLAV